jgi:hypothetical protein
MSHRTEVTGKTPVDALPAHALSGLAQADEVTWKCSITNKTKQRMTCLHEPAL